MLRSPLQDLAWGRTWPDNRKRLFNHPNWICPVGSSKGSGSTKGDSHATCSFTTSFIADTGYGCPSWLALRFAEGPVRLTIHKAIRFERSEYPNVAWHLRGSIGATLSFMGLRSVMLSIWTLPILHRLLSLSIVGWVSPLCVKWRFD